MGTGPDSSDGQLLNEQVPASRQQAPEEPPAQHSMPAFRDAATSGAWNAAHSENRRTAAEALIAREKA